jgi:uncharacterized protein
VERLDMLDLKQAPIELAYHVISSGRLLYQRSAFDRVEYESNVLSQYGDYLPVLRSQRDQILAGDQNDRRVQRYRTALERTRRTLGTPRTAKG